MPSYATDAVFETTQPQQLPSKYSQATVCVGWVVYRRVWRHTYLRCFAWAVALTRCNTMYWHNCCILGLRVGSDLSTTGNPVTCYFSNSLLCGSISYIQDELANYVLMLDPLSSSLIYAHCNATSTGFLSFVLQACFGSLLPYLPLIFGVIFSAWA